MPTACFITTLITLLVLPESILSQGNANTPPSRVRGEGMRLGYRGLTGLKHCTKSRNRGMRRMKHIASLAPSNEQKDRENTRRGFFASILTLVSAFTMPKAKADMAIPDLKSDSCLTCYGQGVVPVRPKRRQKSSYEFTECPQCYGRGTLVCPTCYGTGLGNTRGLLRRPEAALIREKWKSGQLVPGESKGLWEEGKKLYESQKQAESSGAPDAQDVAPPPPEN
eukprot:jgi/Bigna1/91337/estExt_fgenesh1_pg.C_970011